MNTKLLILLMALFFILACYSPMVARAEDAEDVDEEEDVDEDVDEETEDDGEEEDDATSEHPLSDMPYSSQDVTCDRGHVVFPGYENGDFPIGEEVTAVFGFVNSGETDLHVNFTMGALVNNLDRSYYMMNFTKVWHNVTVEPDEEYAFEYKFKTTEAILEGLYHMQLTVFYEDAEELFSSTFVNETVKFHEITSVFDFKGISHTVTVFFLMYVLLSVVRSKKNNSVTAIYSHKAASKDDGELKLKANAPGKKSTSKSNSSRKSSKKKKKN